MSTNHSLTYNVEEASLYEKLQVGLEQLESGEGIFIEPKEALELFFEEVKRDTYFGKNS